MRARIFRGPAEAEHVLADADGNWPVEEKMADNSWEMQVLAKELGPDLDSAANADLAGW